MHSLSISELTHSNIKLITGIDINLDIKGYPIIITDTAGIRETNNPIEKQGIEIAKEKINDADIVLNIYDTTTSTPDDFLDKEKTIFVANKIDKLTDENLNKIPEHHIKISAKHNIGVDELVDKIYFILKDKFSDTSGYLITRARYREALEECLESLNIFSLDKEIELSSEDIRLACRSIGRITGSVEVDEILNNIFGSFCIGK